MSELFEQGAGILYMKVGCHAQEDLSSIVARKQEEIRRAGFAMWGYGGSTCHPVSMVQPFAKEHETAGAPIVLCMQPMESKHMAEPLRAQEYSVDGSKWATIPDAIDVLGSRFALCITELEEVDATLALGGTKVAIGNSTGRVGTDYIRGRVDKACLEVVAPDHDDSATVPIGLVARVVDPYAVFVR